MHALVVAAVEEVPERGEEDCTKLHFVGANGADFVLGNFRAAL